VIKLRVRLKTHYQRILFSYKVFNLARNPQGNAHGNVSLLNRTNTTAIDATTSSVIPSPDWLESIRVSAASTYI